MKSYKGAAWSKAVQLHITPVEQVLYEGWFVVSGGCLMKPAGCLCVLGKGSRSPFKIDVAPEVLSDLQQRLKNTRWSYQLEGTAWEAGASLDYLKELVVYWQEGYELAQAGSGLNQFAHFSS